MSVSMRPYALRSRLIAILVAVVGVLWVGAAALSFRTAHHEADAVFDAQLVQMAEVLLALASAGEAEHVVHELEEHAYRYALPLRYQVWHVDDGRMRLLARSVQTPATPLVSGAGFVEQIVDGSRWRFFGLAGHEGELFVVVGQDHDRRYDVATELALHLLLPVGLGLPLMALAVWWAVGRALRPLAATADAVAAMSLDALTPIRPREPVPAEVAPLMRALNRLVGRVAAALDTERRFTADAAHELRTPLAALRVQAQVARGAKDHTARERALDQVLAGVDRLNHLVEQLLTLARLEPDAAADDFAQLELDRIAESVCAELAPAALARGQTLTLEAEPAPMWGNAVWLAVLVRNLVDNALRYTPASGQVVVSVAVTDAGVCLQVADDGPGMTAQERVQLRGRFARGLAASTTDGVGLGLSIVERISARHTARLSFDSGRVRGDSGGLTVSVVFPSTCARARQ